MTTFKHRSMFLGHTATLFIVKMSSCRHV